MRFSFSSKIFVVTYLWIQGKKASNGPLRGSREPPKETLMVDPLEAKRLAAVEWKLLQERVAFQVSLTALS
jgi:hypothetical protein